MSLVNTLHCCVPAERSVLAIPPKQPPSVQMTPGLALALSTATPLT